MEASLNGDLQLLIPETEYDGAKKGGEDRVGGGQQSVTVHGMSTSGLEVDEGGKTVVHDHYGEVGDTGGEGLVPALSGGDPQDGSHDEDIGEDNEEQAAHQGRDTDHDHTGGRRLQGWGRHGLQLLSFKGYAYRLFYGGGMERNALQN